jgi:hypothetical protein
MLIRSDHLNAFQSQADEQFIAELVEHLLAEYDDTIVELPDYTTGIEEIPLAILRQMVSNGIAQARRYGMTWESTLASFVSLMFVVAPNFDEHPLIRHVLSSDAVAPDERIELLWEHITDAHWDAAGENYDPLAWHVHPMSPQDEE